MHLQNPINYFFVIGCARSGTSILGELIASNPNIRYIFEAKRLWELGGLDENDGHRLTETNATDPIKKQIKDWFENQAIGSQILVEKNPRNSLRIPYVKAIFPDAKFIHIVRDGRDVACSLVPGCGGKDWNHLKPPSWKEYSTKYEGATRCAYVWKQVLETALGDLLLVPHLQVRYEDLLLSPTSVGEEIFRFMGLAMHPQTLEFCNNITSDTSYPYHAKYQDRWFQDNHSSRIGRWKNNLSEDEKYNINLLLQPLLTRFGYNTENTFQKQK